MWAEYINQHPGLQAYTTMEHMRRNVESITTFQDFFLLADGQLKFSILDISNLGMIVLMQLSDSSLFKSNCSK